MKLGKLLERLTYEVIQGSDDIEITELVNDSRKVCGGSVFVCISGAVVDGHQFIEDVASKGATAVIVEKYVKAPEHMTVIKVDDTRYALALTSAAYFGYPADELKVIGITGTKGKTTTTYMVKSILDKRGYSAVLKIKGTDRQPVVNAFGFKVINIAVKKTSRLGGYVTSSESGFSHNINSVMRIFFHYTTTR